LLNRQRVPRLHVVQVGDYVTRTSGTADSRYGKLIDHDDVPGEWLVASGGHVFLDRETDLQLWRRPWADSGLDGLEIDQEICWPL
jgi:hypothetical protein